MPDFSFLDEDEPRNGLPKIRVKPQRKQRQHQTSQQSSGALGCLVMLLLSGGCVYWVQSLPKQTAEQFHSADNRILAVHSAQRHVTQLLKAPASAKWPGILSGVDVRDHANKLADGTYVVNSYVDAQNGFGAMIRTRFTARLRLLPNGNADIISAEILE